MLILLAVFLAVLSLYLSFYFSLKEGISQRFDAFYIESAADKLQSALDTLCVLGDGNGIEVEMPFPFGMEAGISGRNLTLSAKNFTTKRSLLCTPGDAALNMTAGKITLVAKGRIIRVEKVD